MRQSHTIRYLLAGLFIAASLAVYAPHSHDRPVAVTSSSPSFALLALLKSEVFDDFAPCFRSDTASHGQQHVCQLCQLAGNFRSLAVPKIQNLETVALPTSGVAVHRSLAISQIVLGHCAARAPPRHVLNA